MKILISEGEWLYRERMVDLQKQVFGTHVILEKAEGLSLISAIKKNKPDVVILDTHILNGNIMNVLRNINSLPFIRRTILFASSTLSNYQKELQDYQLSYINNTFLDFQKVIRILVEVDREIDESTNTERDCFEKQVAFPKIKRSGPGKKIIWHRNPGESALSWKN